MNSQKPKDYIWSLTSHQYKLQIASVFGAMEDITNDEYLARS